MNRGRNLIGMAAGVVVWAMLWVGGTAMAAALFPNVLPAGVALTETGPLLALILYSAVLSIGAGFTAAAVGRSMRAAQWLAALQLALGIMIEASTWRMAPVWYHLVFLLLLVPLTLVGGRLKGEDRTPRALAA